MFEWLVSVIEQGGYAGIAFLMLLENVFPPIPSELIMPLAGYLVADGRLHPALVVLSGSLGSLAGTSLWFLAARRLNREQVLGLVDRHGRWLTVNRASIAKAEDRFRRHEGFAVLAGRMIPAIRTLISIPAGFARMPPGRFLALSLAGTFLWVSLLTSLGFLLGEHYDRVAGWLDPVTGMLLAGAVVLYVVRLVRGKGSA